MTTLLLALASLARAEDAPPVVAPPTTLDGERPQGVDPAPAAAPPPAPPPHPACLASYRDEVEERRRSAASQLAGGLLGTGSAVSTSIEVSEAEGDARLFLILLASLASPSTTVVAASPLYVGLGVADVLRLEDRRRVLRALQEAQVGDGLVLRDLAIEVGLRGSSARPEDLARLLQAAPEPCQRDLMTWDELVSWAANGVLALPPT
jgi:hypothetical protein